MWINHARSHDLDRQRIPITVFKQFMLHQNLTQIVTVPFVWNLFQFLQQILFFVSGQFGYIFYCRNEFLDWKVVLKFDQVNYLLIPIFGPNDILSSFQKKINSRFNVKSINNDWLLKQFHEVFAASGSDDYLKLWAIVVQFFD